MQNDEIEAKHGDKMIEFRIKFFTNSIAERDGCIKKKHLWPNGMIHITRNDSHGIIGNQRPFNSMAQILPILEDMMIENELTIIPTRRLYKLLGMKNAA